MFQKYRNPQPIYRQNPTILQPITSLRFTHTLLGPCRPNPGKIRPSHRWIWAPRVAVGRPCCWQQILEITLWPQLLSLCILALFLKCLNFDILPNEPLSFMLLNWSNKFRRITLSTSFQLELKIMLRPKYKFRSQTLFVSSQNHFKVVPCAKHETSQGFVDFPEVSYHHLVFQADS